MSKTILVVEDDMMLGELYQTVLSSEGFATVWAKDGEEGVAQSKNKPDFIYLDIMMPKMNGVDVLKHLIADESTKHIPVVMLTNMAQDDIVQECLALGAKGYLLKVNLLPNEMISTINTYFISPEIPINNLPPASNDLPTDSESASTLS